MNIPAYRIRRGFTLAEVLIALAVLGVIAAFNIPKILTAQNNSKNTAIAKEAIATVASAYQAYKFNATVTANTKPTDLYPYFNYASQDTSSSIDNDPGYGCESCSPTSPCLKLHNGSYLLPDSNSFGGTSSNNVIAFDLQPKGAGCTGQIPNLPIFIYFNGRVTSGQNLTTSVQNSSGTIAPGTYIDPSWFTW